MSFLSALDISGSGMTAQRLRLDVISSNIANIETTRTESGEPYRRKMVVFQEQEPTFREILEVAQEKSGNGVKAVEIVDDETELQMVYDPTHPDADENGYVQMPNIDIVKETADAMAASHAYQANITAFNTSKLLAQKALEIGK